MYFFYNHMFFLVFLSAKHIFFAIVSLFTITHISSFAIMSHLRDVLSLQTAMPTTMYQIEYPGQQISMKILLNGIMQRPGIWRIAKPGRCIDEHHF